MSVLVANGIGVRHRHRWLVRELDLRVEPGETVVVIGPPGSGRTSTLLALARRLRLTTGRIDLTGAAALGHVPGVEDPEPVLTVREHVRERLALLGRSRRMTDGVPLHGLDPDLRGRDLSPYERHLLGVTLALLADPAVIALDGVDDGMSHTERADLWLLLARLAADGVAILVTAREIDPALVDRVVLLSDPRSGTPARTPVLPTADYAATLQPHPARTDEVEDAADQTANEADEVEDAADQGEGAADEKADAGEDKTAGVTQGEGAGVDGTVPGEGTGADSVPPLGKEAQEPDQGDARQGAGARSAPGNVEDAR